MAAAAEAAVTTTIATATAAASRCPLSSSGAAVSISPVDRSRRISDSVHLAVEARERERERTSGLNGEKEAAEKGYLIPFNFVPSTLTLAYSESKGEEETESRIRRREGERGKCAGFWMQVVEQIDFILATLSRSFSLLSLRHTSNTALLLISPSIDTHTDSHSHRHTRPSFV